MKLNDLITRLLIDDVPHSGGYNLLNKNIDISWPNPRCRSVSVLPGLHQNGHVVAIDVRGITSARSQLRSCAGRGGGLSRSGGLLEDGPGVETVEFFGSGCLTPPTIVVPSWFGARMPRLRMPLQHKTQSRACGRGFVFNDAASQGQRQSRRYGPGPRECAPAADQLSAIIRQLCLSDPARGAVPLARVCAVSGADARRSGPRHGTHVIDDGGRPAEQGVWLPAPSGMLGQRQIERVDAR